MKAFFCFVLHYSGSIIIDYNLLENGKKLQITKLKNI